MDGKEFWTRVHDDDRMEWVDSRAAGDPDPGSRTIPQLLDEGTVYVKGPGSAQGVFAVPISTILEEEWKHLQEVIFGIRAPKVLGHMTRIVGYFSNLKSWNRSKLAELKDRQTGAKYLFDPTGQSILCGSPKEAACER